MNLQFVDNNRPIDSATRSKIRRHAAKGKNAGRKVKRPSRQQALQLGSQRRTISWATLKDSPDDGHQANRDGSGGPDNGSSLVLERRVGDIASVTTLAIQVAKEDMVLWYEAVAFISSARSVPGLAKALLYRDSSQSIWRRLLLVDQAYYHSMLAVLLECAYLTPAAKLSAVRHINQAFRLINERISGTNPAATSTIAAVLSLSSYDSAQGRHEQGIVHFTGVLRLAGMRGGIARVGWEEPELMQKIYRVDLEYALRLGDLPKLDIQDFENTEQMTRLELLPVGGCRASSAKFSSRFQDQLGTKLCWLWDSTTALSTMVNEASLGDRARLQTGEFLRTHVWLGHKLLNHAPLCRPRPLGRVQNAAHLGLVTVSSSFMCGLDRHVSENRILSRLIPQAIEDLGIDADAENRELVLWLLFLGTAVVWKDPSHTTWLVPKSRAALEALGLPTWDDVKRVLDKFPWINDLYDERGYALFCQAMTYC